MGEKKNVLEFPSDKENSTKSYFRKKIQSSRVLNDLSDIIIHAFRPVVFFFFFELPILFFLPYGPVMPSFRRFTRITHIYIEKEKMKGKFYSGRRKKNKKNRGMKVADFVEEWFTQPILL